MLPFDSQIRRSLEILRSLQLSNGLFVAAPNGCTGYNKMWLRDTLYECIALEKYDPISVHKMYFTLLRLFKKHSQKIDWAIAHKPNHSYQYIHARYHPLTLDEFREEWGNKQNDAVGLLLFKIGDLTKKGFKIIRTPTDKAIVQKLVHYLENVIYWAEPDHGVWEEAEMVHSSSVGACVAGLKSVSGLVNVSQGLISKGEVVLKKLLPKESESRITDMALLSLIWPYNLVNSKMERDILRNIERTLVRERGVIRYEGDAYYNQAGEAEWPMGIHWLANIYKTRNQGKYEHYLEQASRTLTRRGEAPEIYYSGTNQPNPNTPLGWAQALHILSRTPQ